MRRIAGPMAALLTPRDELGALDTDALRRSVDFVIEHGATGVSVNGATGEYARATLDERRCVVEATAEALGRGGVLIAGCGGATWNECYTLAAHAFDSGAHAVLVPAPHFFLYEIDDIETFYGELSHRLQGPILLYNLPQFAAALDAAMVMRLIREFRHIAGIKDSSGKLDTLRRLTVNGFADKHRIVGNDAALPAALEEGCLNGVISGVAGVLPELNVAMFQAFASGDSDCKIRVLALQRELLDHLATLPVPWGLKLIGARRQSCATAFPIPLSPRRTEQIRGFAEWFDGWCGRATEILPLQFS